MSDNEKEVIGLSIGDTSHYVELDCGDIDEDVTLAEAEITAECVKKRKELNMSQEDLAIKADLKPRVIKRFESLAHMPRLYTLLKIMKALGLTLTPTNKDFNKES